jgi:hypothetical protein
MPYALLMDKLTPALTAEAIQILKTQSPEIVAELGQPGTLVDVAAGVVSLEQHEIDYLQAVPTALREAVRATIASAIEDDKAVNVQYSPAYDFEVRVWDYGGAVSVHLSGPYPPSFPRAGFVES